MTPQTVTTADEFGEALSRTPPPDHLAGLRAALTAADEKAKLAASDEVRRTLLAAYWLIPTDRPWPRGDCVKLLLNEDGGTWEAVDLVAEGKRLAKLIAADVWARVFGGKSS